MSATNPIDNEELYQGVKLGGVMSPGRVTLSGHDRNVTWDIKSGQGQSGASMTLKEIPPAKFSATFYLADVDDFNAWPAFLAVINSTVSGASPKALDIYHPDLATQDIKSVCKAKVGGTVHDGKGGQTIAVDFQEYRPPVKKGGSPSGSQAKAKSKAPDPNADVKAQLAALTTEYEKTPWG